MLLATVELRVLDLALYRSQDLPGLTEDGQVEVVVVVGDGDVAVQGETRLRWGSWRPLHLRSAGGNCPGSRTPSRREPCCR